MKLFLLSRLKKMLFQNSKPDMLLNKIADLEKQIEEVKIRINEAQVIKIESITIEKIICEKVETNYKIESIINENLSGTMNIGTVYPGPDPGCKPEKTNESLNTPEPEKPRVNILYR